MKIEVRQMLDEIENERLNMKNITAEEYYRLHKHCPICMNDKLSQTYVGMIGSHERVRTNTMGSLISEGRIDTNHVECKSGCGWKGIVDSLIEWSCSACGSEDNIGNPEACINPNNKCGDCGWPDIEQVE